MTKDYNHRPFAMPVVKHGQNFSGTAGTMITRAPWQSPVNKYYVIRKIMVANASSALSGGATTSLTLNLWDQDLSNTTPVARGSGVLPLITVPLNGSVSGAAATNPLTVLGETQLPFEYFQAGITACTTINGAISQVSGIAVHLELEAV